jgi:hypothetical protein
MLDLCYIVVSPVIPIIVCLFLTVLASYFVISVYRGEKTAFFLLTSFLAVSVAAIIFLTCWSFILSAMELALAIMLNRKKVLKLKIR